MKQIIAFVTLLLALNAGATIITNYPIRVTAQPTDWFLLSSVPNQTNYNMPYPYLLEQIGNELNVITNPYSGIIESGGFVGDGSGLYNIQSGVSMKKMNLIFVGDSLTQEPGTGTDVSHTPPYSTYPLYLRNLWTKVYTSYLNRGVGGWELYNLTNDWGTVLANTELGTSNNVLFVNIGANDFWPFDAHAITNAGTWLVTWDRYCSNAQSLGMKVVAFTVTDRIGATSTTNTEAFRASINAGIRVGPHIDFLVDMDAQNPSMETTNNWRTYDGTHPNTNGAIWQATYVDRCITPTFSLMEQLSWFNVQVTGPPALDKDYLSFISRSGLTGSTNDQLLSALQNVIYNGKVNGWWPVGGQPPYLDALYLFCDTNSTVCSLNLLNTNYPITWHGGVQFTNGVTGDGTTGYGEIEFNPSTVTAQFQQIDALLAADIGTNITSIGLKGLIGCGNGTNLSPGTWIGLYNSGTQVRLNCTLGDGADPSYGMQIACRTNSTDSGYFVSGASASLAYHKFLSWAVDGALPNANITILAINSSTAGPTNFWNGSLHAAAIGRSMPLGIAKKFWYDIRTFNNALQRNLK